jgi:hypothetical protein
MTAAATIATPRAKPMEATITVDGHTLTEGQSMSVRVAITAFVMQLNNDREFAEGLGLTAIHYHARLTEVLRMIHEEAK